MVLVPSNEWERMWAPYDAPTYELVLEQISTNDVVLEIGAGDLRLSRQIAARARWVYALEINRSLLPLPGSGLPANLQTITADARLTPFPENITTAVLLMRHCTQFALYFRKLQACGCRMLITNARWGMNVETVDLNATRYRFEDFDIGWYACRCGCRGFKPGRPQALTEKTAAWVWELDSCPVCSRDLEHDSRHVH